MINGNMVGSYSHLGKTFTLVDESGAEYTGVVVENEQKFTATDNDVREGSVYASDEGASVGTKVIPAYHTTEGYKAIMVGDEFVIDLSDSDRYDYTKLQAIICPYNTSIANSVSAEKVAIDNNVYAVQSTTIVSAITKNTNNKTVSFGITNTGTVPYILRYFTYKEIE